MTTYKSDFHLAKQKRLHRYFLDAPHLYFKVLGVHMF